LNEPEFGGLAIRKWSFGRFSTLCHRLPFPNLAAQDPVRLISREIHCVKVQLALKAFISVE